jgi:hypothetical protein
MCLLFAAACSRAPSTARIALAVSPTPPDVKTIEVFVVDVDKQEAVASATTAADSTEFELEVPAETPLDFRVIARTDKPGPPAIGAMPAYFGSSVRTIALGSQEVEVGLTIHKAGVLTLAKEVGRKVSEDGLALSLEEDSQSAGPAVEIGFDALPESFVARSGRQLVRLVSNDDPSRVIRGGRGLFIAPEAESLAIVDVETSTGALDEKVARTLSLELLDDQSSPISPPDVVRTRATGTTPVRLRIEALDGTGTAQMVDDARVHVSLLVDPASSAPGKVADDLVGLPATSDGILFQSSGRFRILASAVLGDGRTITGRLEGNALAPGVDPSVPRRMILRIEDPTLLVQGTSLEISLLDARGLYAQNGSGALDLSMSDPWAYFPDGVGGTIGPSARGHADRRIARPSGPRGSAVIVKATLTSTAIPDTLTATIALPILTLP